MVMLIIYDPLFNSKLVEDTERNDGSPERPYYVCDDRMWQILGVRGRL